MSQGSSVRYLGERKISSLLFRFSIPCVMGLLISALQYRGSDFYRKQELGYLGNAATGVSFPIICIANAFAWCIGDGAAAYLSILAGRNYTENAHKCVGTCMTVTLIIGIILTALCLLFNEPLMRLFGASDQTVGMAVEYFAIVAAFFPLYLLLSVMNSMIRADGSPSYAMFAMLTGAITNIALDPLFIFGFKWGIAGAAWATGIVQQAVHAQESIIRKIAENGSCVIVGRAADRVLRDSKDVVRVFIHAPREFRINSIMERYGDTYEAASHNVKHSDEARSAYYRSISGQIWRDTHLYEICLDASAGREKCAEAIIRYARVQ